ncbi:lytic murein transglycosylase [Patescibacteria group bacterium]|nr:lytic murein transglycosylase [Patescibacteria group bacterium]
MFKTIGILIITLILIGSIPNISLAAEQSQKDVSGDSTIFYWQEKEYQEQYKNLFSELEEKGFTRWELNKIFYNSRVEYYPALFKKPKPEAEKPEKKDYTEFLLNKSSIQNGRDFLTEHDSLQQSVETIYGPEPEILTSIFRIETNFGKNTGGSYRIFNVFNTIFLLHWKEDKQDWARRELIVWLILCKEKGWNHFSYGSSAGAFGYSQFLPSSYQAYAVDGDNDGRIDLFNWTDAHHSVGNYLAKHGWKKDNWVKNSYAIRSYNRSWFFYVDPVGIYASKVSFDPEYRGRLPVSSTARFLKK